MCEWKSKIKTMILGLLTITNYNNHGAVLKISTFQVLPSSLEKSIHKLVFSGSLSLC